VKKNGVGKKHELGNYKGMRAAWIHPLRRKKGEETLSLLREDEELNSRRREKMGLIFLEDQGLTFRKRKVQRGRKLLLGQKEGGIGGHCSEGEIGGGAGS